MTDEITITSLGLAAVLDRLGLPPAARDRVEEIDRKLADELAGSTLDAELCASLVFEAADLIVRGEDARAVLNALGDFDGMEWGVEGEPADRDFAERMFDLESRLGGDTDWGEGGVA